MESIISDRRCSDAVNDVSYWSHHPHPHPHLRDGIARLLSHWHGLQVAVKNQWGGSDSLQKSDQLADDILTFFYKTKEPFYVDDLENLLHENMLFSFNTDIEDGSIEEVATQLMMLHDECKHAMH